MVAAGFLLYPLDRGAPPIAATLLAVGLLVGGAVATGFVLDPLGRLVGAPFERSVRRDRLLGRANLVGTAPGPGERGSAHDCPRRRRDARDDDGYRRAAPPTGGSAPSFPAATPSG